MKKDNQTALNPQPPEQDPGLRNIAKWLFLIAVLVVSWFLLDWLINGK